MKNPVWHPLTQHGLGIPELEIDRAQGAHLYTKDGRKIIDAISSWWVTTHGHCHPKIVNAVQTQAQNLDQIIFAGLTHAPAENLARELLRIVPDNLQHVFYSDSGSTSVEVALKMAIGYWKNKGAKRSKILALEGGYHGDTFGAMAAGARGVFSKAYEEYLFEVRHIPPDAQFLEDVLKAQGDEIAAFIFEPLVQGAAGMRIYDAAILKSMHDLCRAYGVILIADEVMTGFGRTGTMFACEQAGIAPDILCLSKGLTGGFLPMGATLCTAEIYDAFFAKERSKMFFHSTSFTANPLSCAAALASLQIWREEPVQSRINAIAAAHKAALKRFPEARSLGTIFALDIAGTDADYLSTRAPQLYQDFLAQDILLRPIGNCLYIMPPYCIGAEDLNKVYDAIDDALTGLQGGAKWAAALFR